MARRVRQQGYQQVIRRLRCMYVEVVKGSGTSEIVEKAPSAKPTVELFYQWFQTAAFHLLCLRLWSWSQSWTKQKRKWHTEGLWARKGTPRSGSLDLQKDMLWVGTVLLWHVWYSILSSLSWSLPLRMPLLRYVSSSTRCIKYFLWCLQSHPIFDIHWGLIWTSESLFSTDGSIMNTTHNSKCKSVDPNKATLWKELHKAKSMSNMHTGRWMSL